MCICAWWGSRNGVCVSVPENHLSTLPDIDIYSTGHNGKREDGGGKCWMMKNSLSKI